MVARDDMVLSITLRAEDKIGLRMTLCSGLDPNLFRHALLDCLHLLREENLSNILMYPYVMIIKQSRKVTRNKFMDFEIN